MPWSAMWGISGRLNNTRQVPAPRAFVNDQTGLVEERRDGRDLSHLCCFASRTQQGSSGALTRHRLLHGAPPSGSSVLPYLSNAATRRWLRAAARVVMLATRAGNAALDHRREHVGNRHRLRAVLDAVLGNGPCSETLHPWLSPMARDPTSNPDTAAPPLPHWSSADH
jgi:hypothetical protein